MIIIDKLNSRTVFTRMCIAQAIVELLKTTSYDKLTISAIVKKAGVARMSFYKYYHNPYDALTDYMNIIIQEYVKGSGSEHFEKIYMEYDHILYSLKFFDQYANYFLTLAKCQLHGILLDGVNRFMEENILPSNDLSLYKMYSYAGGLLNTFLKWEEGGKKESAEEVADFIFRLYNRE